MFPVLGKNFMQSLDILRVAIELVASLRPVGNSGTRYKAFRLVGNPAARSHAPSWSTFHRLHFSSDFSCCARSLLTFFQDELSVGIEVVTSVHFFDKMRAEATDKLREFVFVLSISDQCPSGVVKNRSYNFELLWGHRNVNQESIDYSLLLKT